jgi:hypothetical protein
MGVKSWQFEVGRVDGTGLNEGIRPATGSKAGQKIADRGMTDTHNMDIQRFDICGFPEGIPQFCVCGTLCGISCGISCEIPPEIPRFGICGIPQFRVGLLGYCLLGPPQDFSLS